MTHADARRPLVVELFCGTFGWSHGWLARGGRAVGFDIEHLPHHGPVPEGASLVLQDAEEWLAWRSGWWDALARMHWGKS